MPATNMTTNLPNGITNVVDATAATLGSFVAPDPSRAHIWFTDFDEFSHHATNSALWLSTAVGSSTAALTDADGGILLLTTGGTEDNGISAQWSGWEAAAVTEAWTWEAGKSMWFKTRLKLSNATQTDIVIGLAVTDTSPWDAADGLFFLKVDGSTTLNFKAVKTGVGTSTVSTATLADDTFFTVGFWWDAAMGVLTVYYNDNPVGNLETTTNFPSTELAVTLGLLTGSGDARTSQIDYIMVAKDRQTTFA